MQKFVLAAAAALGLLGSVAAFAQAPPAVPKPFAQTAPAIPAGGVGLPFSCNIPTGTATQTIRNPVLLSATEISFFDVGTGAVARSLWVNPTLGFVASVACVSGKPLAGVAAVPRGLSCRMSTMNPVPTGGNGVRVISC